MLRNLGKIANVLCVSYLRSALSIGLTFMNNYCFLIQLAVFWIL